MAGTNRKASLPFFEARVGEGRRQVHLVATAQGGDWHLRITGGRQHIGAVALAGPGETWSRALGPHKEGPLAEQCAVTWFTRTGTVCAATAGIHQDDITREEIEAILENVERGLEDLIRQWEDAQS